MVVSALRGSVVGVGASIVATECAGAISGVACVQHGRYPTTMPCKRRSAATSSGLALPVVIILAVQMFSQWFIRSAVKPRGSHSGLWPAGPEILPAL